MRVALSFAENKYLLPVKIPDFMSIDGFGRLSNLANTIKHIARQQSILPHQMLSGLLPSHNRFDIRFLLTIAYS